MIVLNYLDYCDDSSNIIRECFKPQVQWYTGGEWVVIYDEDGTPVATGGRERLECGTVFLYCVCVLKKYQKQGYGTALVKELIRNEKEICLEMDKSVSEFYEKVGLNACYVLPTTTDINTQFTKCSVKYNTTSNVG